ncbi:hypothetical protein D9758_003762 [Tetrapyrgos nigripes]|uniref:DNA replication factor Cdt1 C-terminal domain-containing protein n=1 Tax=Tetrapyrgos nigripes TaxID=182062 RepID=A0A8H5GML1_9AGAR|nr:hypothetical protein D9758_003762 [Tetrapyrgos nigripes]
MAEIYSSLSLSPKKRRVSRSPESDDNIYSPKKLRTAPPTPPVTPSKNKDSSTEELPSHLTRLEGIQTALQQALSHALATCAVSPSETGVVRNVLNHVSLNTYAGLSIAFTVDDLRRLCWIWEWDGKSPAKIEDDDDEENPFVNPTTSSKIKDWTRGGMSMVITPTTHLLKAEGKRVPAYGLGIEVEVDLDKDQESGMAAVARWTAAAETRRIQFHEKLISWTKMYSNPIPRIPLADLPALSLPMKSAASKTRTMPVSIFPPTPSSNASPTKRSQISLDALRSTSRPSSSTKNSIPFPSTPSSRSERLAQLLTPRTPRISTSSNVSVQDTPSGDATPRGRTSSSASQTPTTARREALYERIRQRSLSASPTKNRRITGLDSDQTLSKDQVLKLEQEETRKRFLLGRLGNVAESVWMLFSTPATGTSSLPTSRKRRALARPEVTKAIVKSSAVPISSAEASESLDMLTNLCPFFLKPLEVAGKDWLEMPASTLRDSNEQPADSQKKRGRKPAKQEAKGLKEVKEIIQRELELRDE